jgi:hypothetical protein
MHFASPYATTPPPVKGAGTTGTLEAMDHQVALWAGVAAFFGSLLAIGVFDLLNPDKWVEYLGSLIVAAITSGAVYSQQRLADAKAARSAPRDPPRDL